MWLAMQIASFTPSKKWREQVLEMTNHSRKYYCALLVSSLVKSNWALIYPHKWWCASGSENCISNAQVVVLKMI